MLTGFEPPHCRKVSMTLRSICVFYGASSGALSIYSQAAKDLGRHLAEQGLA
jgi:hypothetical protein